jgi:hypothetical protein
LVVLQTSSPVMWCKEHLGNFSVLRRVRLSILVKIYLHTEAQDPVLSIASVAPTL